VAARPIANTGAALTAHSANMSADFAVLRFGAPSLTRMPDDTILGAFWC